MNESEYLANQLKEVLLDGKWIADTNFREAVRGLPLFSANSKIPHLNSIASLVFHINYYMEGILNVFRGGDLEIRDRYSFDMQPLTAESHWQELQDTFFDNAEAFIEAVRTTPEEQWSQTFVKKEYGTYRRNIDGFIAHSYYHLGQISLIKKMVFAI